MKTTIHVPTLHKQTVHVQANNYAQTQPLVSDVHSPFILITTEISLLQNIIIIILIILRINISEARVKLFTCQFFLVFMADAVTAVTGIID